MDHSISIYSCNWYLFSPYSVRLCAGNFESSGEEAEHLVPEHIEVTICFPITLLWLCAIGNNIEQDHYLFPMWESSKAGREPLYFPLPTQLVESVWIPQLRAGKWMNKIPGQKWIYLRETVQLRKLKGEWKNQAWREQKRQLWGSK